MSGPRFNLLAVATVLTAISFSPAHAKKISKYCQGDRHMHFGSGTGVNQKSAKLAAKRAWSDFTVFEYGRAYGRWSQARFKRMSCRRGGGQWACSAEANPCRTAR